MIEVHQLLCSLPGCQVMLGPELRYYHLVAPHEPLVVHAVWEPSSADFHVLHEAEVADLVGNQLIIIFVGGFVGVGHDAAHIVGGLLGARVTVGIVIACLGSKFTYLLLEEVNQIEHVILELGTH